jgi:hypothetical protein
MRTLAAYRGAAQAKRFSLSTIGTSTVVIGVGTIVVIVIIVLIILALRRA